MCHRCIDRFSHFVKSLGIGRFGDIHSFLVWMQRLITMNSGSVHKRGAVSLPEHVHSILVVHKDPEVTSYCQVSTGNCAVYWPRQLRKEPTHPRHGEPRTPQSSWVCRWYSWGWQCLVFRQNCDQLLYVLFTPVLGPQSPGLPVPPEEKLVC